MKNHIFIDMRADCNTNDIWKAAIRNNWTTSRINLASRNNIEIPTDANLVRYYGNTLQGHLIEDKLPIKFSPINLEVLAKTPLTKRDVYLVRAEELEESRSHLMGSSFFIKPAQNKWFPAKVYGPNEFPKRAQGGAGLASDFIYVQEPVNMINEVRCFCLNGKILTASYYRIGHEYCPLGIDDVDRPEILDKMVEELAPHYPPGVVLDFAYTSKKEWCFIEPNEAWASGLYGCNPEKCLEVIVASQYEKKKGI